MYHSVAEWAYMWVQSSFVSRFIFMSYKFIRKCLQILLQLSPSFLSLSLAILNYFSPDLSTPFHLQSVPHSPPSLFSHPSSFPISPPAMAPCHPRPSVLLHIFFFFLSLPLPYFLTLLLLLSAHPSFVNSPLIFPRPPSVSSVSY